MAITIRDGRRSGCLSTLRAEPRALIWHVAVSLLAIAALSLSHNAYGQQTPAGLVAAYGFEEGSGQSTVDSSGRGNVGTISGASWTTSGKVGSALSFDGTNDIVNIADAASLDLTSGMTLEAWVYPTASSGWRTVLMKEVSGELSYVLYANEDVPVPASYVRIGGTSRRAAGSAALPLNTWMHLATTYDGATLRLYVNGVQVGSQAMSGAITTSTRPLRIGGNTIWGEYFAGRIDEVRIYSRALTATEIAADMSSGSGPAAPKLTITAPVNDSTVNGTTVDVSFSTSGDISQASYVHLRLDDRPETIVTSLNGQVQMTNVAPGAHSISGYLARADQSKIEGSDAATTAFAVAAPPAGPKLTITAPANNSTINDVSVDVTFTASGDLTEASHVHLRLDGGPEMMVMSLNGQVQLTDLAPGIHSLAGYIARADHTKIEGSDAAAISFTVSAAPLGPTLAITAPANNATLIGATVNVTFATSGDPGEADHVHLRLDGGPEIMVMTLSGTAQISDLTLGPHTLDGFVVRADHTKISGSDAATVNFTVATPDPDDPLLVGQWSSQMIDLPTVAVDLALLHTGKAIFWAGDFASAPNYGELWDPATNLITPAPNPFSNIFCSSHVHLADGRLLVAGGHDAQNGIMGIADANTFDPVTETWTSLPDMSFRRWYPTLTMLGDGRAIITSGSENSETQFVEIPEVYDPVASTWTQLGNARLSIPQYPMMFLLADGRLLQAGSIEQPTSTRILNIGTQQWSVVDSRVLEGGSGVMYAPGRIMKSGSSSNDGATPTAASAATTYVLDMNVSSPAWRETTAMQFPRTFHNLTSLADGTVLVTSGSQRKSETNLTPAVLQGELWSPQTETWTTMASMRTPRIYHSTAILLPDGRVAVSGSGNIAGGTDQRNLEIFSPPYLFRGARPVITSVPTQLKYGTKFTIQTPDAASIAAVNLLRPGAATHNFDQDQRFVPLSFTQVPGGIEVQPTANPNVAPPGHYMLFLINSAGVPSIAQFVRFPAGYEDSEPPTAPGGLAGSGTGGGATLSWLPATDNVGVVRYQIYRSNVPGFVPSAATLVGESTTTSFTDVGLPAGTYYYVVVAVDSAGTTSVASNEVAVTVAGDAVPPTVSLTNPANGSSVSGAVTLSAAASDNVGVTGVQFKLDGVALGGEDTAAPYSYAWNTAAVANGAHVLTVIARDASNNATESLAINVIVSNVVQAPAGLVAAYGFEEGSGQSAGDSSGQGNIGAISGASWTTSGKFGGALSFDGTNDMVTIADAASLDLTGAMTLQAWVYPTALSDWRTVVMKEVSGELSYALYAHDSVPAPASYVRIGGSSRRVAGSGALPLNTWTHLATTYDGSTLRLYVNGVQAGSQAMSGAITASALPLRIGGNSVWGEYFAGRIDEVRIYNRALTATEITGDMSSGSGPTAPKLTFTTPANNSVVSGTTVQVSYSTAGDLTEASFAHIQLDGGADMVVTSLNGELQVEAVVAGSHSLNGYLARADHSKINGSDAATVNFTTSVPDTIRPTVVLTSPRDGDTVGNSVTIAATASDNVGVMGVQFKLDGVALGSEDTAAPYSYAWNTAAVANGAHVLTVIARDASNNATESLAINVIVSNVVQAPAGLVAAYGFEEGSGQSAGDSSGGSNIGAISGASWTTSGKFGGALSFDGTNDMVTIADAASLDLTGAMTLQAWVYPTALSDWRTVVMKEVSGELSYALYAHDSVPAPASYVRIGGSSRRVAGSGALPLNTWTHLATTYDGSTLWLYVNGVQVGSQAMSGAITASALPLRIGGNSVWGEYFSGRIDEVRIHDRALSAVELQASMNVPVVAPPALQPSRSSPIVIDAQARRVWVVNPDADTVTALHADTLAVQFEIAVGSHPTSLALDNAGQVWVTCRDDDSIRVLDATTGALRRVLNTAWGSAPASVVFAPDGATGYIAFQGSGQIQRVAPATQTLGTSIAVGAMPRALAVTADGKRLLVTQFVSTDGVGTVRSIALDTFAAGATLVLPLDSTSQDGSLASRGLPNYLAGIAIDPANGLAWVVGKKDNILRGQFRDGQALTFETAVRAMVSRLDLNLNQEQVNRRIDLDNASQPSAIALSDSGALALVALQGNNRLVVLNQLGAEVVRADTGLAPQGIAIDPVSKRVFTQDLMSRTVSVFDATRLLTQGMAELPRLAQVVTVATEKLSTAVLRGKQIFYNAADPRMSRDSYISCASCHLDGEHDGRVWDFTDRGEGLRNTISLKGQGGNAGSPLHWSGNFDEVQDFENDIRSFFGGTGFMSDADFTAGTRSQPLGNPKAGISVDLDALAAYLGSLSAPGRSPHRQANGAMTAGAAAGSTLFSTLGCQSCHSGPRFSDSNTGIRHDVGTLKPSSGQRAGAPLDGLDTPALLGLWASGPYLHDGSAQSLRDVLTTANPTGRHGNVSSLSQVQIDQLAEYLMQLEAEPQ